MEEQRDYRDCLSCGASLSADDKYGEQILICSLHGYVEVTEWDCCDDWNG